MQPDGPGQRRPEDQVGLLVEVGVDRDGARVRRRGGRLDQVGGVGEVERWDVSVCRMRWAKKLS